MNRSRKTPETPSRPITFKAAEDLGAFELAQLWADRTAWPIDERTLYDELAELAVMSALGTWLRRWQPLAIHGAVLAGARPEAVAGALGNSLEVAFDRWHEWAVRQRDFIIAGKPGITEDEYEEVARRFAAVGTKLATALSPHGTAGLGRSGGPSLPVRCLDLIMHTTRHNTDSGNANSSKQL